MVWIDFKKADDIVPQSWIIDCLKMYVISNEDIKFIENNIKNWRVELKTGRKSLTEVKIQSKYSLIVKNLSISSYSV